MLVYMYTQTSNIEIPSSHVDRSNLPLHRSRRRKRKATDSKPLQLALSTQLGAAYFTLEINADLDQFIGEENQSVLMQSKSSISWGIIVSYRL